ncbi:MAG: replication protein RepA [Pseudomonadota bacterium]
MSNPPTILQRRIIDAAVEIQEVAPETPEFLHSVLCQVGLPRKATSERVFERNNGKAGILIEAGRLYKAGKYHELPLPHGVKPRLAIIHISSEAVRAKSREIDIGESIRELLVRLNLPTNGPTRFGSCVVKFWQGQGLKLPACLDQCLCLSSSMLPVAIRSRSPAML